MPAPATFYFFDPPYLPVSEYADFKRYTKEQFYEEDHIELATEIERLHELGCHTILTNSNHPLVHEKYAKSRSSRKNETLHIIGRQGPNRALRHARSPPSPCSIYESSPRRFHTKSPSTRRRANRASKNKLLAEIWAVASQFDFETAIDLFSGSGVVGYMMKSHGKATVSNDYMAMAATFATAMIENNQETLSREEAEALLQARAPVNDFVESTFKGLYFSIQDNRQIDILRANIKAMRNRYKRAIAMSALMRACLKKRPRGIFTYIGHRYDDGRKDLQMSFRDHFLRAVHLVNSAVFDNHRENKARKGDAMTVAACDNALVYIDPPYYSPFSDNEYVRVTTSLRGLRATGAVLKFRSTPSPRNSSPTPRPLARGRDPLPPLIVCLRRFRDSVLIVSYSSNSQPAQDEMLALLAKYKAHVEVVPVDYKYSFGNQGHKVGNNKNDVSEYLFVGF